MSDFERGRTRTIDVLTAAQLSAVVGLDLTLKTYASGARLKDGPQVRLLNRFLAPLRDIWRIGVEVAVTGDRLEQRAFDAVLRSDVGSVAIEAFTRLADFQAQVRAIGLKVQAAGLDRVLVVLPATKGNRRALHELGPLLRDAFPLDTRAALRALRRGEMPPANGIVLA